MEHDGLDGGYEPAFAERCRARAAAELRCVKHSGHGGQHLAFHPTTHQPTRWKKKS